MRDTLCPVSLTSVERCLTYSEDAGPQILLICSHYATAILPRDLKAPNASEHLGSLDVHIQDC